MAKRTTQAGLGIRGMTRGLPAGDTYHQHLQNARERAKVEATLKYGGRGQFAKVRYGLANWFGGEKFAAGVTNTFGNKAQMDDAYSKQVQSRVGRFQGELKPTQQDVSPKVDQILGVVGEIATRLSSMEKKDEQDRKTVTRLQSQPRAATVSKGLVSSGVSAGTLGGSYFDTIQKERELAKAQKVIKQGGSGLLKAAQYQATKWLAGERAADYMAQRGARRADVESAWQTVRGRTYTGRAGTKPAMRGRARAAASSVISSAASAAIGSLTKSSTPKAAARAGAVPKATPQVSNVEKIRSEIAQAETKERTQEFEQEVLAKLDEILRNGSGGGGLGSAAMIAPIIAAITAAFAAKPLATSMKAASNALMNAQSAAARAAIDAPVAALRRTKETVGSAFESVGEMLGFRDRAEPEVQARSGVASNLKPRSKDNVEDIKDALLDAQEEAAKEPGSRILGQAPTVQGRQGRTAQPPPRLPKSRRAVVDPPVVYVRNEERTVTTYIASIFDHPVVHPGIYKM